MTRVTAARGRPRIRVYGATVLAFAFLSSACAHAVSSRVQQACRDDYYQHCSQFSVGTDELRQCMRQVGENLSTPCLVALVQEGEITKADIDRHNAAKSAKSATKSKANDEKIATKEADDPKEVKSDTVKKKKKKKVAKTNEIADPSKAKSGKTGKVATAAEKAATDQERVDPKTKLPKKKGKKLKKSTKKAASGADAKAPAADASTLSPAKGKKAGKAKSKAKTKTKIAETAAKSTKPVTKKTKTAKTSKKKKKAAEPAP